MCPLRIILIFLSATLAGFFVLKNLKSPPDLQNDDVTEETESTPLSSKVNIHIEFLGFCHECWVDYFFPRRFLRNKLHTYRKSEIREFILLPQCFLWNCCKMWIILYKMKMRWKLNCISIIWFFFMCVQKFAEKCNNLNPYAILDLHSGREGVLDIRRHGKRQIPLEEYDFFNRFFNGKAFCRLTRSVMLYWQSRLSLVFF